MLILCGSLALNWMSTWLCIYDACSRIIFFAWSWLCCGRHTFWLRILNLRWSVCVWNQSETTICTSLLHDLLCSWFTIFGYGNVVYFLLGGFFRCPLFHNITIVLLDWPIDLIVAELAQSDDRLLFLLRCNSTLSSSSLSCFWNFFTFFGWITWGPLRRLVNFGFRHLIWSFRLTWTLLPVRLASGWIATRPILLIRSMIKVKHWELRLVKSCIGCHFRIVLVFNLYDRTLSTLPSVS